jgi:hypothetical protein
MKHVWPIRTCPGGHLPLKRVLQWNRAVNDESADEIKDHCGNSWKLRRSPIVHLEGSWSNLQQVLVILLVSYSPFDNIGVVETPPILNRVDWRLPDVRTTDRRYLLISTWRRNTNEARDNACNSRWHVHLLPVTMPMHAKPRRNHENHQKYKSHANERNKLKWNQIKTTCRLSCTKHWPLLFVQSRNPYCFCLLARSIIQLTFRHVQVIMDICIKVHKPCKNDR